MGIPNWVTIRVELVDNCGLSAPRPPKMLATAANVAYDEND
jgi:hypothetical protein